MGVEEQRDLRCGKAEPGRDHPAPSIAIDEDDECAGEHGREQASARVGVGDRAECERHG